MALAVAYLFLVRSMRCIGLLAIALALSSCTAAVIGPYAGAVGATDAQQIGRLAATDPGIRYRHVFYIHVVRPGCVFVECYQALGGSVKSTFIACKRSGNWVLDWRSIDNQGPVIITE
jgi:hypothetical protein